MTSPPIRGILAARSRPDPSVVPIRAHGAVVGEIDIDSHDLAAFSAQDREFLEKCAAIVGNFMERT